LNKQKEPENGEPTPDAPPTQSGASPPRRLAEGALEGIVTTGSGPLASATVVAEWKAITDAEGRFVLGHLPPGTFTLQVSPPTPRYQSSTTSVTLETEKKASVFVFLKESAGTVEGDVTDGRGNMLANAEVFGLLRATQETETVKVDEDGHYFFKDVPPGKHFIRAKAPGYMTEGKSVDVVGSKPTSCSFVLMPGALSLVGNVTDMGGKAVDAEVYLMKGGIVVAKVKTRAVDGSYAFHDLVPANYTLTVAAPGLGSKGWTGKLERDELLDFRLEAQPPPSLDLTKRFWH
jgi:hypothetical protein